MTTAQAKLIDELQAFVDLLRFRVRGIDQSEVLNSFVTEDGQIRLNREQRETLIETLSRKDMTR